MKVHRHIKNGLYCMNNLRSLLYMKSNKVTFIGTGSYRTNFPLVENSGVLVFRSLGKTGT